MMMMSTLRHFPSNITHCIEWSRIIFNDYFIANVNDIKNYFSDFDLFQNKIKNEGSSTQNLEKLLELKIIIEIIIHNDYDKFVEYELKNIQIISIGVSNNYYTISLQIQKIKKENFFGLEIKNYHIKYLTIQMMNYLLFSLKDMYKFFPGLLDSK